MMKKSVNVILTIVLAVLLIIIAGCVDYKAYDIAFDEPNQEELDLIDEIAEIEKELIQSEGEIKEEVVEEIVLKKLDEEPEKLSEELQVITIKENELVKLKVNVTDPDNDEISYSYSKPLNEKGEWQTNYGDAGQYIVTLSATDGKLTTTKKIKMIVEKVNVAPVIEGVKDLIAKEGEVIKFAPKVSDPNGDSVEIVVSEPLKDGSFEADHSSAGEYKVKVAASDGELETEKSFTLTITDVNLHPEISGLQDITIKEGELVKILPVVDDLDGDEVKVTISNPIGDDGIWETGYNDHGEYFITVTANDGKDMVTRKIKISISDVNMPPVFISIEKV